MVCTLGPLSIEALAFAETVPNRFLHKTLDIVLRSDHDIALIHSVFAEAKSCGETRH